MDIDVCLVSIIGWTDRRLATDSKRLTFGVFSFIVTGSHCMFSSIVSTIMFIIQFNFFLLTVGLDSCVAQVSAELPIELVLFCLLASLFAATLLTRVLSTISSGIDCFTLRFCQNIGICELELRNSFLCSLIRNGNKARLLGVFL